MIMNRKKYITILFCLIIIPRFDNVPDNAMDIPKKTTAQVLIRALPFMKKRRKSILKIFTVSARYNKFSKETSSPTAPGESIKSGLNQKVKSLNIKG
jgi:hypothetical protein